MYLRATSADRGGSELLSDFTSSDLGLPTIHTIYTPTYSSRLGLYDIIL